ncbi:MAG: S-methyl-5-thioribose-1-phosphate isomerase [Planctomycetota bacterium]|nr:S-methyl-5-thioribose-1-phosphate isomerase [Planctomycetota bacterium]MCX8039152.1 S-methyl-5-thioribose-1-phosphate isomerase [Planctomycetota bacterium]MDW8372556.1 S-methyl-5-thioribose-1-phosphate isomerase [Planctomycetota bacterium]
MPRTTVPAPLHSLAWDGGLEDGRLLILDQRRLPAVVRYVALRDLEGVIAAIEEQSVRGAPAVAIAGAYGVVLHLVPRAARLGARSQALAKHLDQAIAQLSRLRTTPAHLARALERQRACFARHAGHLTALEMCARLLMEAKRIHREDEEQCARIADHGAPLLSEGIVTIGNSGALATGGIGTALGCVIRAHQLGRKLRVFVGETRPHLQGARLTCSELQRAGVPAVLLCDSAIAALLADGQIKAAIVAADRIAANGDIAAQVGAYQLAVLAKHHGVPFYAAAPAAAFDPTVPEGRRIPIDTCDPEDVRCLRGCRIAPAEVAVWSPGWDITPARLITALITDRGVIRAPNAQKLAPLAEPAAAAAPPAP